MTTNFEFADTNFHLCTLRGGLSAHPITTIKATEKRHRKRSERGLIVPASHIHRQSRPKREKEGRKRREGGERDWERDREPLITTHPRAHAYKTSPSTEPFG